MILTYLKLTIQKEMFPEHNRINVKFYKKIASSERVSLYTLFLSPKGKLITDAYIYKPKVYVNGKKQFR